jgi:hypothetical protein
VHPLISVPYGLFSSALDRLRSCKSSPSEKIALAILEVGLEVFTRIR